MHELVAGPEPCAIYPHLRIVVRAGAIDIGKVSEETDRPTRGFRRHVSIKDGVLHPIGGDASYESRLFVHDVYDRRVPGGIGLDSRLRVAVDESVAEAKSDCQRALHIQRRHRLLSVHAPDALLSGGRVGESVIHFYLRRRVDMIAAVHELVAVALYISIVRNSLDVAAIREHTGAGGASVVEERAGLRIEEARNAALDCRRIIVKELRLAFVVALPYLHTVYLGLDVLPCAGAGRVVARREQGYRPVRLCLISPIAFERRAAFSRSVGREHLGLLSRNVDYGSMALRIDSDTRVLSIPSAIPAAELELLG